MCANFQAKQTALTFLAQICPEIDLRLEFQKTNVGIRISILKISCVPISGKTNNFDFFDPNVLKNEFWGGNFKNLGPDSRSAPPRDNCANFQSKWTTFNFSA